MDGQQFPAEVHFVHVREDYLTNIAGALADTSGLAVLGIFIEGGADNATWFNPISNAAMEIVAAGDYTHTVSGMYNLNKFVHRINPKYKTAFNYWTYEGSLTTPPCSQAVTFIIAEHPIFITNDQVK